ncbi:MAG: DUF4234 domain-containing protein [Firmicutes bacterium]|nr:DUF4234 domain-containing protein [Bacillota bacterium]
MIQKRDIVVSIILSIVTCGIYNIYWFVVMTDDVKNVANDNNIASGGLAFVYTLLTCGIYGFYWAYKMGELMKTAQTSRGMQGNDNAVVYLILQIVGLQIVSQALIQSDLNKIADLNTTNSTNNTIGA